jgi:hypothetical protein
MLKAETQKSDNAYFSMKFFLKLASQKSFQKVAKINI